MRNSTMVAVSAAAAAAAALSGGVAQASTPDWLTLATVEDGHDSLLPGVCEAEEAGALTGAACATVLGSPSADEFGASGATLPESPGGYGGAPAVANVDLRNFARWQVCGVAVGAGTQGADCDNSIEGTSGPVRPGSGVSLVNADTTGAFQWSVCGVSVGQANAMTDC